MATKLEEIAAKARSDQKFCQQYMNKTFFLAHLEEDLG